MSFEMQEKVGFIPAVMKDKNGKVIETPKAAKPVENKDGKSKK